MGRVFSSMKRELINYNVENRAHKVISRDKLPPAPRYESVTKDMERMQAQGLTLEDMGKKHAQLNENLKNIHVKSTGPAPDSLAAIPPSLERFAYEESVLEPISVPKGKITLKIFLEMLSRYQEDKIKYRPEVLAAVYNLDLKFVETAVDRYQIFKLNVPKNLDTHVKDLRLRLELKKTLANIKTLTIGQTSQPQKEGVDAKEIVTK
ncbi:protein NDUFAF4 homolog [Nilaparvata lugens]|uniref:protein NDUFAF4 homolog n=1 Tax=Nilaparvata lugens TaxID=108931 RepID=UPI00193D9C87|nr:protein NDUFAF4 homolog [Nilaparvata lugens]